MVEDLMKSCSCVDGKDHSASVSYAHIWFIQAAISMQENFKTVSFPYKLFSFYLSSLKINLSLQI